MSEVTPPAVIATTSHTPNDNHASHTAGSLDVGVLSRTISAAVSEALRAALSGDNLAAILKNSVPDSYNPVLPFVEDAITGDNGLSGIGGIPANTGLGDFTSIAVGLPSRVSAKLKSKIWANEFIDFGALRFSIPQNEGRYSLSMMPSAGPQCTPQLTLKPFPSNKKINSIHQWSSAFLYQFMWSASLVRLHI